MKQQENESKKEYIARLCKGAEENIKNLDNLFTEMKDKGITICGHCGCSIYKNKKHKCE